MIYVTFSHDAELHLHTLHIINSVVYPLLDHEETF